MDSRLQDKLRAFLGDEQRRAAALISAGYQGAAYLYDENGHKLVIKEAGGGVLTRWFHQLMLRREARVYQRMSDVAGVPHSPGVLDDKYLVLEFIEGRSLQEARHELRGNANFFDRLRKVISDFHAAGVAHGDLKRKDNVIVKAGDEPVVIDFGTAVARQGGLFDRLMFRLVRRFDKNAWIKLKYDRDYAAITADDMLWYRPTIVEKAFSAALKFWRTVTFRQARKRRQRAREGDT
jgi:predicted Ser/Thr protein kinase